MNLLWALRLAFIPIGAAVAYDLPDPLVVSGSFYAQGSVEWQATDWLRIGASERVAAWHVSGPTLWPNELVSGIWLEVGPEWLVASVRYYCWHPVIPLLPVLLTLDPDGTLTPRREGNYLELAVEVRG